MIAILLLLFWVAFTALFAFGQGWLMYAIRKIPKGSKEANRQEFALHYIFGAVWFLPALIWLYFTRDYSVLLIAGLIRLALFDPVLNMAAGDEVFNVGTSAIIDKALQFLAAKIGVSASVLSAVFRLAAIAFLVVILWRNFA